MTQSGQGEEPAARPAREGIVLPSDGGEPLLPGMTGGHAGQPTPAPATPPTAPPPSAPPGGQAWGNSWGPGQNPQNPPAPPQAAPGQSWGTPPGRPWQEQQQQTPTPDTWGTAPDAVGGVPSQPLPQDGAGYGGGMQGAQSAPPSMPSYGHDAGGHGAQSTPSYRHDADGQGAQNPPPSAPSYGHDAQAGSPMPAPQQPGYGQGGPSASPPTTGGEAYGAHGGGAPLPPAGGQTYGTPGAGGALPPAVHGGTNELLPHAGAGGFGAPLPPADEGATQYIPPVGAAPAGADNQATSYLPPVGPGGPAPASSAPGADEGATQYIPPVGPGALPPEVSNESTQILGRARQGGGAGPAGAAGSMPPAAGPDAEATRYIPPVTGRPGAAPHGGAERQPLSDFDSLFRSEPGGEPPAAATQQLPRFQQPQPQQQGGQGPAYFPPGSNGPHGSYGPDDDDGGRRGGRTGSRLPVIAAVGIGIAVLGIGAGALLAGGDGDDEKSDDNRPVSATAPATEGSASSSADPAEQQAIALDKLLADSGDSRTAVINAVAAVKSCGNLGQAAQDLRGAAKQRNQLVTDLSKLSVDKLPNHAALTGALTKAWQASASADNHYAAWADQVAGNKKLCKKGQARATGQTQAGNRASGTASEQKKTAAQLWNPIAKQYGLTERQPTQL
ncbi:hypothetical protein [Streptomyces sp. HD]|uniref:hypothetical protein n=1 Tax=Streptomyces sp. HD TaxID=3020892 RepID=UPI00232CB1B8|nr:hypothetical protein [Streptomyces sp. HD]MDC0769968.1 hypothetical protein [Streptomyces sp. HD]